MLLAASLTLSPFLMSVAQFWLVIVWALDAFASRRQADEGFKAKFLRFWHNKSAVIIVAFFFLHIVGLAYTTDFLYAYRDIKGKLPLLVLPIVMSSMPPLDRKRANLLLFVYVLSVFVATLFSFSAYQKHDYVDVREISHFISHIRFCLHIVFCIAIIGYYVKKGRATGIAPEVPTQASKLKRALNTLLIYALLCWFAYQIFIFESLTGYAVFAAVVVVSAIYAFLKWKPGRVWRIAAVAATLTVLLVSTVLLMRELRPLMKMETVDFGTLEHKTALGNDYWHDTVYNPVEDGKYVGLYYCRKELHEAWNQRSTLPIDSTTLNGENLEATLARYLTSKDLRKDAQGVAALTDEDIRNIEQGVANYNNWRHPGLRSRLSVTLFEYNMYRRFNNPNGGSLSQRIEYTRAAFHIIRRHWLFGVGTGDVALAFREAYDEIQSPLREEYRFRAHNQYLSIMIAFGAVGLALFLLMLFYPSFAVPRQRTYLYTVFLVIMLLSMFPEDTLETQAGASMFAFFEAFFLFSWPKSGQKD